MRVQSLRQEDLLEKEMATHSSIVAWRIPRIEEPGRLQSLGSQKNQTQLSDVLNNNKCREDCTFWEHFSKLKFLISGSEHTQNKNTSTLCPSPVGPWA